MKREVRVFFDSDVMISSVISSSGAAFAIINKEGIEKYISSISLEEIKLVTRRLNLNLVKLEKIIEKNLQIIKINKNIKIINKTYKLYVIDQNDAHIVCGAKDSNASFLISYNIKHFRCDEIRKDFDVIVLTPALFLQYLRSRNI